MTSKSKTYPVVDGPEKFDLMIALFNPAISGTRLRFRCYKNLGRQYGVEVKGIFHLGGRYRWEIIGIASRITTTPSLQESGAVRIEYNSNDHTGTLLFLETKVGARASAAYSESVAYQALHGR